MLIVIFMSTKKIQFLYSMETILSDEGERSIDILLKWLSFESKRLEQLEDCEVSHVGGKKQNARQDIFCAEEWKTSLK